MKSLYLFLTIAFTFVLVTAFQCEKEMYIPDPAVIKYWFKENLSVAPYQQNYHPGDTIWLELNIPDKTLFDTISNSNILYDSSFFASTIQTQLLYNYLNDYSGPLVSYTFPANSEGKTYDNLYYTLGTFKFGCNFSAEYRFRLGIVLLKYGVYQLRFINDEIGYCCTCLHDDNPRINYGFNVSDTHLDLYKSLPLYYGKKSPDQNVISALQNKTSIVFEVN